MTSSADSGEEQLADDIVPEIPYEAPLPSQREFLPWHRPRKQFVRQYQWCEQINRLLTDAPLSDGILKYLGLPGTDLLDLRHFYSSVCEGNDISFRFLGFNASARPDSAAQVELNISLDEVRRLPQVDPRSDVIGDDFALLSKNDSIAWKRAHELGPFDVINLDLCDGFGAQTPGSLENDYYNAVNNLMVLQARSPRPWLMLLTTRADKDNVDLTVLAALVEKYKRNLIDCTDFRTASAVTFNIDDAAKLEAATHTPSGLLSVFMTGLCKWLLNLGLQHRPQTAVELKSAIGYRVVRTATKQDLISLALRFTPQFHSISDPMNLATGAGTLLDECKLSTMALKRAAKLRDADHQLACDETLNQAMVNATAALLSSARYDVDSYREWVEALGA